MTLITTKAGVTFGGFSPAIVRILMALAVLSERWCVVITSASDGEHDPSSWHYRFAALDVRTKQFTPTQKTAFLAELRKALGPAFTVLLENEGGPNEHAHIQPVKNTTYTLEQLKAAFA